MGKKGMHVFGGVIDPDYLGEVSVMIYNSTAWFGIFNSVVHSIAPSMSFYPDFISILC